MRGDAREPVEFVGFDACLDLIITMMEERYDKNWSADRLQQEFYNSIREKGEKLHQFEAWLEQKCRKLQGKFPARYDNRQMRDRLFHWML